MKLLEYQAKEVLASLGIAIPPGRVAHTPEEAAAAAAELGPVAVKAQVPVGGRGKAGGIKLASSPDEARAAAQQIIGMDIKGFKVPLVYCETALDIELSQLVFEAGLGDLARPIVALIKRLYRAIPELDAVTAEINPLVVTKKGEVVAGDAKLETDENAAWRHKELEERYGSVLEGDPYEVEAKKRGLTYVSLDGDVGI